MDIKTQLKILLTLKHVSMKELAEKLTQETGEVYTPASLYGKINRGSISYNLCCKVADILGYKLEFVEKQ